MTTQQREIKRQLFHIILGLMITTIFYFNLISLKLFSIIILAGCTISIAWKKDSEPIITFFLKHFERNGNYPGKGAMWFCIGSFIVLYVFPKNSALASIMILTLGDSVSHYIGRFHGHWKHPLNKKRHSEGTIAGVLIGFLGALIFVPAAHAFFASLIAMNIEAMEWKLEKYKIDDNVLIPLVAGIVLHICSMI